MLINNMDKQAQELVEGQQPSVMPTEQKTTEVSAPIQSESSPAEQLPDEVKERTRLEFEKLKSRNKELSEELNRLKQQEKRSALDAFAPTGYPAQVQQTYDESLVEPIPEITPDEDGYIDVSAINNTTRAINEKLKRLEEEARLARQKAELAENKIAKYEHTDKSQKVYAKYPHLDPTSEVFDEKFSDLVRKELLDQMVNYGKEDYLEAAERVRKDYYDPSIKIPTQTEITRQENVEKREQINALTQASKPTTDLESLVRASRLGDKKALYERLKRSNY